MHQKNILAAGKEIAPTNKVLIMLHGRGGSAADILSLSAHLHVKDFTLLAPQATNNSWYPYSFLVPPSQKRALAFISIATDPGIGRRCHFERGARQKYILRWFLTRRLPDT